MRTFRKGSTRRPVYEIAYLRAQFLGFWENEHHLCPYWDEDEKISRVVAAEEEMWSGHEYAIDFMDEEYEADRQRRDDYYLPHVDVDVQLTDVDSEDGGVELTDSDEDEENEMDSDDNEYDSDF